MKICLLSHEYEPFPSGGIATYHNVAVKKLAEAGHEVHVVTNAAWHGSSEPSCTLKRWQDGNLHVHRLFYFDENRVPPDNANFLDLLPSRYGHELGSRWAALPSNLAAFQAAQYVEHLHSQVGLDVIESPEYFAEAFYILRRRASGERHRFPPVCIHGHVSSRIGFAACHDLVDLGYYGVRQMMLREEYCLQEADALLTPSRALMEKYESSFGDRLPSIRDTMPYFLEVPDTTGELPPSLRKGRYLVTLGRIEPRKGSGVALQAFARLAADNPDLKLVYLGGENWPAGESFDEMIAAELAPEFRDNVVRPGAVPRADALAIVKNSAAFLHPALWDNYPCAVMEAMALGAACIVSDRGGQSEMVEDGTSGLIVPVGDVDGLAAAIQKVLADDGFAAQLRQGAQQRMSELTDTETLVRRKIELFEAIRAQEAERAKDGRRFYDLPTRLQTASEAPTLPGRGLVVIDAGQALAESVKTTCKSVHEEILSSPDWSVAVLTDPTVELDASAESWPQFRTSSRPPWMDLDDDALVVYVLAGTRFDFGMMGPLAGQLVASRTPCGSFLWLRPSNVHVFPYSADLSHHDVMIGGRILPPVFAVRASHLKQCQSLNGLVAAQQRLCALMAAASAAHSISFRHTGKACGDFYGQMPFVTEDMQHRAIGYLDTIGLLDAEQSMIGNTTLPMWPNADIEKRIEEARQEVIDGGHAPAPQDPDQHYYANGGVQISQQNLEGLQRAYDELSALKKMKVVRMMRKLGAFGLARKLFPKAKRMIGSGD